MQMFYVILSDMDGNVDWYHPSEINAKDKQDAFNAISESCDPQFIKKIFTKDEFNAFMTKNKKAIKIENQSNIGSDNYNSGKDFLESMINLANESAENRIDNNANNNMNQVPRNSVDIQHEVIAKPQRKISNVKYFTDNGVQFKVENGIIYKKCWVDVELDELSDDSGNKIMPEYRIINSETGKVIKNEKYAVQHLIWQQLSENL